MWLALAAALSIRLGLDLYMPVPEANPVTREKVELGRPLFHDRRLSRDRSISCASCHIPERAFANDNPEAVGVFGRKGNRNVPAIIDRDRAFFWGGHFLTSDESFAAR